MYINAECGENLQLFLEQLDWVLQCNESSARYSPLFLGSDISVDNSDSALTLVS